MSTKPNPSPSRPASSSQTFSRQKAKPGDRVLTSEAILHDIAEFKKRGGRIDVLATPRCGPQPHLLHFIHAPPQPARSRRHRLMKPAKLPTDLPLRCWLAAHCAIA